MRIADIGAMNARKDEYGALVEDCREERPAPRPFWLVWSPQGPYPPRVRHASAEEAAEVAARMARKYPGQEFMVLAGDAASSVTVPYASYRERGECLPAPVRARALTVEDIDNFEEFWASATKADARRRAVDVLTYDRVVFDEIGDDIPL